jgi:hypothetical protein
MNTSSEAIRLLEQAAAAARQAAAVIDDLIAPHDYQDVAALVTQAAAGLLDSATRLMQSDDVAGLEALEAADDLLDAVYDIIESELDDE